MFAKGWQSPICPQVGCAPIQPPQVETNSSKILKVLEKVSAVALLAFAAYTAFLLTSAFFVLGFSFGVYKNLTSETRSINGGGAACSQGFLEQITGIKLPPALSLAVNVATTICHIEEHSTVFAPIVGFLVGASAGNYTAYYGALAYKKIELIYKNWNIFPEQVFAK